MTTPTQQTQAALRARLTDGSLAGNWTLNPAQSTAVLRSKSMWGLTSVKGVFRDLEGSGTVSAAGEITGAIALPTGSLDTKNSKRDTHLRSADFFLSEKYPAITFSVGTIVPASEGVTISGTLTVRDSSRPISFPATVALTGDNEMVLDATVQVDRSEFGLTWNKMGMVSMNNAITIHAVLTRS
jgi:polyisoprenoid-binding protein YceI